MAPKRVAIIGAGASGMLLARAFKIASGKDPNVLNSFEIVCFERQADWGGLWNFTWRTRLDENGEPIHCSMYRNLWTIGPKECSELADYSFVEHFGKSVPSFMPRAAIWDYLNGNMTASNIKHWFRFKHSVQLVAFDDTTKKFSVTVWDTQNDRVFTEDFDYVAVATGHYSIPNVPSYPGFDTFPGRIIHSHDFRNASEFANLNILIVGSSYSSQDIASQCWKFGSKSITISYRTTPTGQHWPERIDERPILEKLDGRKAYFKDGSVKEGIDVVILCTGYIHSFPFMESSLRLKTNYSTLIDGLYKGTVFEKNPQLFYIGMQDLIYSFPMFDVQAYYVRDIILGRIILPPFEQMRQYHYQWQVREAKLHKNRDGTTLIREKILFQSDYVKELMIETDCPNFDTEAINGIIFGWLEDRKSDIMGFRNLSYKSIVSGTEGAKLKTKWIEQKNDSLEEFLSENSSEL